VKEQRVIDLTVVVPGSRPENWGELYRSVIASAPRHSIEVIVVGIGDCPEGLLKKPDFHFHPSRQSPTCATHYGFTVARGDYVAWAPDDGAFTPNSLDHCIEEMRTLGPLDFLALKYTEGDHEKEDSYWQSWTHVDLRLKNVSRAWLIAPMAMYKREGLEQLGGFDCRYEHVNFSTHDLAFRAQRRGAHCHITNAVIFRCSWTDGRNPPASYIPIIRAYKENDYPIFSADYNSEQLEAPLVVDIGNWKNAPTVWKRRQSIHNKLANIIMAGNSRLIAFLEPLIKKYWKYFLWKSRRIVCLRSKNERS
jgi:hypothetical protein